MANFSPSVGGPHPESAEELLLPNPESLQMLLPPATRLLLLDLAITTPINPQAREC